MFNKIWNQVSYDGLDEVKGMVWLGLFVIYNKINNNILHLSLHVTVKKLLQYFNAIWLYDKENSSKICVKIQH